jgi:hypothetical protein
MVESKHMKGVTWCISARILALKMFYSFKVQDHMFCIARANLINLSRR